MSASATRAVLVNHESRRWVPYDRPAAREAPASIDASTAAARRPPKAPPIQGRIVLRPRLHARAQTLKVLARWEMLETRGKTEGSPGNSVEDHLNV